MDGFEGYLREQLSVLHKTLDVARGSDRAASQRLNDCEAATLFSKWRKKLWVTYGK
jgi:hypothetical protein